MYIFNEEQVADMKKVADKYSEQNLINMAAKFSALLYYSTRICTHVYLVDIILTVNLNLSGGCTATRLNCTRCYIHVRS